MEAKIDRPIPCKIHDSSCVYHACMSPHCQKENVLNNGLNWGPGECEINNELLKKKKPARRPK